ncbi:MAG TPA: hypothetical protein ACHBX0_03600 [Arsenophonus sp.]
MKALNDAGFTPPMLDLAVSALQKGRQYVDKFSGAQEVKSQQTVTQEQARENSTQQTQHKIRLKPIIWIALPLS